MKDLSDIVDNKVFRNTKLKTLKTKVNNLKKKILDAITLIYITQHNTDKQNLQKKEEKLIKNIRYECFSAFNCFEYKN